jgi:hypothetical protein
MCRSCELEMMDEEEVETEPVFSVDVYVQQLPDGSYHTTSAFPGEGHHPTVGVIAKKRVEIKPESE